jgi:hypothetical protein
MECSSDQDDVVITVFDQENHHLFGQGHS